MRLPLLLVSALLLTAFAAVPTASAGDLCTQSAGCLDTCNMRWCLAFEPDPQPVIDEVEGIVHDHPGFCTYRLCL